MILRFPEYWKCTKNKHAEWCAKEVKKWAQTFFPSMPKDFLVKLDVAGYGGWPYPISDEKNLLTIARFFTYWIIYDDYFEKTGLSHSQEILSSFENESFVPDNHYALAWKSCIDDFRHMPKPYLQKWQSDFAEWLHFVDLERQSWEDFRREGKILSFEDYLHLRRYGIGQIPASNFIFLDHKHLIDQMFHENWPVLTGISADIVAVINDLFALSKDIKDKNLNLALCYCNGPLTQDGLIELIEKGHDLIQAFDENATGFDPMLTNGLRWNVYGFAKWHESAHRYSSRIQLADSGLVELHIA